MHSPFHPPLPFKNISINPPHHFVSMKLRDIEKLGKYLPPKKTSLPESICECISGKIPLEKIDFGELRLGKMALSYPELENILSMKKRLIATSRTNKALLEYAIFSGVRMADIEIESPDRSNLVNLSKDRKCRVIISYHDFQRTPSIKKLESIKRRCFEAGADIAKLTCMAHTERDCEALLSLADEKTIAFGMGEYASYTRIACLLLGSPHSYAFTGMETAPGQMSKSEMLEMLAHLSL